MKVLKKISQYIGMALLIFMFFNLIKIYNYAFVYSEAKSDIAIILGAGTNNGILSPVFKERINHGIYLYQKQRIQKIILTGGRGQHQTVSDSEIAKNYAIELGIPADDLLIEDRSHYTSENLTEAKLIMDSLNFSTALIISDPLHMKRAMALATFTKIKCQPSPTKTSMYRTTVPKLKFLAYETCFYTLGKLTLQY